MLVNGDYVIVEFIQHEILESPQEVYNLSVRDYHTYFVTGDGLLVHNKCGPDHANSLSTQKHTQGYVLRDKTTHDILKYGETTRGFARYTKIYLETKNAYMDFLVDGSKAEMHQWQHDMILNYISVTGQRPPMNLSLY